MWICGFGLWAALAPLDGAVVASGSFVATGQNKQVQHLEGGIIREMLVREGDLVEAGQTLVRLDDTPAKAKLRRLVLREYRLLIMQARLEAQIDGKDGFRAAGGAWRRRQRSGGRADLRAPEDGAEGAAAEPGRRGAGAAQGDRRR